MSEERREMSAERREMSEERGNVCRAEGDVCRAVIMPNGLDIYTKRRRYPMNNYAIL